ncbi:hypothetical protein H6G33_35215 [Calothrix sp. FACHB-1219]|uniref:hypothetical protein n=1 Tax=unclassified Calothrix TaxID=2619626 RepID=UPI001685DDBF|nr:MULTISPECIES: hypothetical protein [unclassified Calothrix]MBD2207584.1 hypothetical protein [Calothrix sp. FACHB-168]MBD2222185.1 hypothetical protein [Calothrix sp. FACHB-1219]
MGDRGGDNHLEMVLVCDRMISTNLLFLSVGAGARSHDINESTVFIYWCWCAIALRYGLNSKCDRFYSTTWLRSAIALR